MSYSSLYVADGDLKFESVKEYRNSWGTHTRIWDYYFDKIHVKESQYDNWMMSKTFWNELNEYIKKENTPAEEQLIILSTYYPVLFHISTWKLLLKGFEELSDKLNKMNPDYINHYPEIIEDIRKIMENNVDNIEFVTIKGTSVDDLYEYHSYEDEEGNEIEIETLHELEKVDYLQKVYKEFDLIYIENGKITVKKINEIGGKK